MLISWQEINSSNNETKYHWNEKVQFFLVKTLSTVLRQFSPRFYCITFVRTNCLVTAVVVTFLNVVLHPDLRRYLNDPGKRELGIKAAYQKQPQLSGSCLFLLCIFFFLQSTLLTADTTGTSSQSPHHRESIIAGVYFRQTSVIYFCLAFSCCPYCRSVRKATELTVNCCHLQLKSHFDRSPQLKEVCHEIYQNSNSGNCYQTK